MPWNVRKRGERFVVVKKGTGKVVSTHETREGAQRKVRALYANEPSARRKRM